MGFPLYINTLNIHTQHTQTRMVDSKNNVEKKLNISSTIFNTSLDVKAYSPVPWQCLEKGGIAVGMRGKMVKKHNDSEMLLEKLNMSLAKDVTESLSKYFNMNKCLLACVLHQAGYNSQAIADIAKTTDAYVRTVITRYRKESKLRERVHQIISQMPDWFRTTRQASLPVLVAGMNEAAQIYAKDPEKLIDKPQLAKLMLKSAGIKELDDDRPPTVPVMIQLNVQAALATQLESIMAEQSGEVINTEE